MLTGHQRRQFSLEELQLDGQLVISNSKAQQVRGSQPRALSSGG